SPTTSTRRSPWPTGWSSCPRAGSPSNGGASSPPTPAPPPTTSDTTLPTPATRRPATSDPSVASCSTPSACAVRVSPSRPPTTREMPREAGQPHDPGTTTAHGPQRVPDEHRPPRGVLAAPGERPVRPPRRRPLPAAGADRGAGEAGLGLLRRLPGAVGRHR